MRDELYPLVGLRRANDLSLGRKAVRDSLRGLMFYYGIDFHDLSPNSLLNISAFIVVCEAFLRIQPHFRLWLKVFNVKPKVVDGQHAEFGGAMVSKLANVSWPKGTFVETVKEWQKQWFYITEPRGAN